ncbi:hypothetical protein, partial [Peribacillus simplex]|uniref:hypothetical protein n=1 Tax=Peribacillus simplex TaxID=1478 RepID=UPI002989BBB6
PTARGKRVPGVEINVQIVQAIKIDKLDFHRVCLQSETHPYRMRFSLENLIAEFLQLGIGAVPS